MSTQKRALELSSCPQAVDNRRSFRVNRNRRSCDKCPHNYIRIASGADLNVIMDGPWRGGGRFVLGRLSKFASLAIVEIYGGFPNERPAWDNVRQLSSHTYLGGRDLIDILKKWNYQFENGSTFFKIEILINIQMSRIIFEESLQ